MKTRDALFQRAVQAHRRGRHAEAERLYRTILRADPANARVLGLIGQLQDERGDRSAAIGFLKRAASDASASSTRWAALQRLVALVAETDRAEAARLLTEALSAEVPAPVPGDTRDALVLLALLELADRLGAEEVATRLAARLEPLAEAQPQLRWPLGRRYARRQDARRALAHLSAALGPAPNARDLLVDTIYAARLADDGQTAGRCIAELARHHPLLIDPQRPPEGGGYRVLVLNNTVMPRADIAEVYNNMNLVSSLAEDDRARAYAIDVLLVNAVDAHSLPPALPQPDVVYNNVANAEWLSHADNAERVARIARSFGVPVINDPLKVVRSSRDRNSIVLSDIEHLVFPRTRRFVAAGDVAALVSRILEQFELPVIVRGLFEHGGRAIVLCPDAATLAREIEARAPGPFYAIQYHDTRMEPQLWAKYRMFFIDATLVPTRLYVSDAWNVHLARSDALMRERPDLLALRNRFREDPESVFGAPAIEALRELDRRLGLDMIGVDCVPLPDGRVFVFEANAAMRSKSASRHPAFRRLLFPQSG